MRDRVRFYLGEERVEIASCDPTATLLDWLRLERGLTGTKEGCAEGDCGACTVAIGRPDGERIRYEAINSCIRFLPTLDGCQVLAIEHLKKDGALHPVQAAMVEHHASQCGFCTPGFVMSLFCLAQAEQEPSTERIDDAIAGNLCRCTGYRPIVNAGQDACAALQPGTDAAMARKLGALQDEELVAVGDGERRFFAPASLDQLGPLLQDHPDAVLVAGATDVGLWVTKEMRRLDPVIFLGRIGALQAVRDEEDTLEIGSGVTLTEAKERLGALHPHLAELMRRFGGEQVRNAGTVGGNIANGSPIGDLPPALIALDATLVLRGPNGRREMPLERFFLAYRQQDREAGEFVETVIVPKLGPDHAFHASKVSKRFDEDISALCGAFRLARDEDGIISEARLAFGGMAAIPKRAAAAEATLIGRIFNEEAADAAAAALAEDFTPLDDWRASAKYRLRVAGNLIRRFAIEEGEPITETRVAGLLRSPAPLEQPHA
jgi:xanthine dehydrogenase small subunit